MAFSNFQHGFKNGVTIRGIPIELVHPGKVFWVGNNATRLDNEATAADGNDGTFLRPYATVMAAYSACAASRGDIIFVRPGYAETLTSSSWTLNKAGVAIIGLGSGSLRPTLTLDGTSDTVNVTAGQNALRNFVLTSTVASLVAVFTTTTAADFTVEDCYISESGSGTILTVLTTASTSNAADGFYFAKNVVKTVGAGTAGLFAAVGIQDRWYIADNYLSSAQTAGIIVVTAAKELTALQVLRNFIKHAMTAATGVVMSGGTTHACLSTGVVAYNNIKMGAAVSTALPVAASITQVVAAENRIHKALGSISARVIPVATTVD